MSKWISSSEFLEVPAKVAVCPECGGKLRFEVTAWETENRKPIDDGIEIDCENEPDADDPDYHDKAHRWWQGEWQDTVNQVRAYARRNVRVRGAETTLPQRNEQC
jgi:hypothetical protein